MYGDQSGEFVCGYAPEFKIKAIYFYLLLMWLCDTVKPYVLPVMDCVTGRCGRQVQPTKMTLACQRVLSSSEVRASDLEHGGSWVWIPSGAQIFFCVLLWLILYISLYFPLYINISGINIKIVKSMKMFNFHMSVRISQPRTHHQSW